MAIKLGEIFVSLGLSTASFTKGLNDAKKLAFGSAKELERSFRIIGTAVASAMAGIAVGLSAATVQSVKTLARIHELSQASGTTAETFSRLAHGARLSGIDMEGLSKGLVKLSKTMFEAASGGKEQQQIFKALEIAYADATGKLRPVEDVLLEVADRFKHLDSETARTALSTKLFSKEGAALIPWLIEGAKRLRELAKESDDFGNTASSKAAKAADELTDNLERLWAVTRGAGNAIAGQLLPSVVGLSDKLVQAAKDAQTGETIANLFISILKGGGDIAATSREFTKLSVETMVAKATLGEFAKGAAAATDKPFKFVIGDEAAAAAAKKHAEAIQSILDKLREQIATVGKGSAALEVYRAKQEGASVAVLANVDALGRQLEFLKATQALFAKTAEGAAAHQKALSEILGTDALSRAMAEIQQFEAEVIPGLGPSPEMLAAWDALTQKLENVGIIGGQSFVKIDSRMEEMRLALSELDDDMGSLGDHTRAFGEHAINSFAFAIAQGRSLREVFKGLLQDLLAMVLRMMLLRTIGSIFGGLFGGGGGGGGGINIGASNFPGVPPPPNLAHGGPVWPGQAFMVGERGPELFRPDMRGTIVPHSALAGRAGGAGDQIIQIDARGADFGTVAKISALMSRAHSRELLRMMQDRQLRTA